MDINTVFVTGGSGFIGRHLVRYLVRSGCHVRCLVRPSSSIRSLRRSGAELWVGELSDTPELRRAILGCDAVFHLAGLKTSFREQEFLQVNVEGTRQIAQACASLANPPVLLFCSSLAAAGPAARRVRQPEDPCVPISKYGRSKRLAEFAAAAWASELPVTIVRPGIVFGPWDRDLLPMFRSIAHLGVHVIPTFAPPALSLIHVDDLVQVLVRAAKSGTRVQPEPNSGAGAGYYFACAETYPNLTDLGRMIARCVGREHVFLWHLAEPLPWLIAGVNEVVARIAGRPPLVGLDKMAEAMTQSWIVSPRTTMQDLAFSPAQSLEQRIRETTDWYRCRNWLRVPDGRGSGKAR